MSLNIKRNVEKPLLKWARQKDRKPLIVRGARQIGKTFSITLFAKNNFKNFITLNLEKSADKKIFSEVRDSALLIKDLEILKQSKITPGETLIFIDEIQESANAMQQLRFFYEEVPELHVIAAGSLLEVKIKQETISIPVGRVEYLYMFPLEFNEFLNAMQYEQSLQLINSLSLKEKISDLSHQMLLQQFREYLLIGGMPEVVSHYAVNKKYFELNKIYESLITGFRDDINKYATGREREHLEFLIETAPKYSGSSISYHKFAGSEYNSRDMSNAFKTLERALLLKLIRPSNSLQLPVEANYKAAPKLVFFDQGLVSYQANLSAEFATKNSIQDIYRGKLTEQALGQTLWSQSVRDNFSLNYWARFKAGASAELDYLISFGETLIPIEAKSGAIGKLRSLHEFIDRSETDFAVKVTASPLNIEAVQTIKGKEFRLLNIPHYLAFKLKKLCDNTS